MHQQIIHKFFPDPNPSPSEPDDVPKRRCVRRITFCLPTQQGEVIETAWRRMSFIAAASFLALSADTNGSEAERLFHSRWLLTLVRRCLNSCQCRPISTLKNDFPFYLQSTPWTAPPGKRSFTSRVPSALTKDWSVDGSAMVR